MYRFGQIYKFLPRAPLLTGVVTKPVVFDIPSCSRGAKAAAKGGGKGGGKKGAAMVKPVLEVETDAHKLVHQVCGLNYKVDGESEPVMIRPDSEYPDWLWTISVKRPLPPLEEQDQNTKEYWLQVVRDMKRKRNRLMRISEDKRVQDTFSDTLLDQDLNIRMTSNGSTGSSGTPTKDKSKNRGEVDLSNSGRGVWLVKVPKYISDRWEKAPANTEVGKLKIKKKVGGAKPDVKFTLSDNICAPVAGLSETDKLELIRNSSTAKQIPKEHMFKVSNIERQKLGVFSCASTPDGEKLSLEGKVVQRAECCPISDNLYNMIKKDALQKAGEPRRMLKQLDKHVTTTFKPVSIHESSLKYERQKKVEGKKMRDDKDKVQEIIFALFEKHQYYNIKDLERETRQPIAYLKEILKEVCNYSVKPPHRNMWELKPEYRHYKQDQAEPEKKKKKEDSDSDSD